MRAGTVPAAPPPQLVVVGPLPPPYAGQSVSFEMLVDGLRERGVPHTVVDLGNGTGSEVGRASIRRVVQYGRILPRFVAAVARRRGGTVYITIAQSSHGFARDAAMIALARAFGHRVVAHLKGGNYDAFFAAQPPVVRRMIRATLLRCHCILVLGERLRRMYDFEPRLAERIRVVPNGLPDPVEPRCAPKRLPLPGEGPPRLIFLSNLIESKGWPVVLEAVRLLRDRYRRDVRCDFYGEFLANPADDVVVTSAAHAQQLFSSFVAEHRLHDRVAWRGSVAGEDKREALRQAHCFLLPTRYDNEGQPVSIIEAMAYGNVVVSTDYRAITDLVEDGVSGRLVPYGDADALAEAIDALIADPDAFERMSAAALERYRRAFTRRAHLDTLLPYLLPDAGRREADRQAVSGKRVAHV
jgi:glycosyltransferase involved in cell wall biosynthesis